jgi:peptidoglycan/xylan/chitin deacetylase (PgdA/CDA1 family)
MHTTTKYRSIIHPDRHASKSIFIILVISLLFGACSPEDAAQDTPISTETGTMALPTETDQISNPSASNTTGKETATYTQQPNTITPTTSMTPYVTPSPEASATPIPNPFKTFNPGTLWEGVEPETYLEDTCQYLALRWDPERSAPGTIVAPIMFHSVRQSGRPITDATSISEEYFHSVLTHAAELGFETITSKQLIGFLYENALIPKKSMIMILDDRRPGVTERFLPYLESNDWTLTLGWIIEDQRDYLWDWMEQLHASGRLDVQSHGFWHRYIVEETPEEVIREELFNPIPILEEHFGYRPSIFIWPGGNFTALSVEIAHEAGYKLAFTAYAHGPLMFNWIPQSEEERLVGDPLMTLPRFWSTTAWISLDETLLMGEEAESYALQHYSEEAEWFQINCGGELPPFPTTP